MPERHAARRVTHGAARRGRRPGNTAQPSHSQATAKAQPSHETLTLTLAFARSLARSPPRFHLLVGHVPNPCRWSPRLRRPRKQLSKTRNRGARAKGSTRSRSVGYSRHSTVARNAPPSACSGPTAARWPSHRPGVRALTASQRRRPPPRPCLWFRRRARALSLTQLCRHPVQAHARDALAAGCLRAVDRGPSGQGAGSGCTERT
jgi:hypothetical protein